MSNPLQHFGEQVINAFEDIHRVDEVQNALLIEMGKGLGEVLIKLGLYQEATDLGHRFEIAAGVLRAGADATRDRLNEEEE